MLEKLCFVGLGAMGSKMAARLTPHFQVFGYKKPSDPSIEISHFITLTNSLEEAMDNSQYIVTCLPTSKYVQQVAETLHSTVSKRTRPLPNITWLDCTSGDPFITKEIASYLEDSQIPLHFFDTPISGGPSKASIGELSCMVGGNQSLFENLETKAQFIISQFASNFIYVGELGSGHAVKAINNFMNVSHLLVASEALSALQKYGIDVKEALKIINKSSGRSLMTEERFPLNIMHETNPYNHGFKLGLMKKDIGIACGLIQSMGGGGENEKVTSEKLPDLMDMAIEKYGYDADYTEATRLFIEFNKESPKS